MSNATFSTFVKTIKSDTELTLQKDYNGNEGEFNVYKNNTINDNINVYFGSKRIFFTFEVTYLSS